MEIKKELRFVNKSNNENPKYADDGSSGFDLRAWITEESGEITIQPFERMMVHTGLYFDIPENMEIQIRPRSGLAIKHGITVINTPATIDESYTGECCVLLINLSKEPFVITNGDRIAQGILTYVSNGKTTILEEVDEITKQTERGSGGFGHTGMK